MPTAAISKGLDHRTVWRWHFYAGLFCIPFVLWLSVTGTIFLFHPQIQHWLDRPYDTLLLTIGLRPIRRREQRWLPFPVLRWTPINCLTPLLRLLRFSSIRARRSIASTSIR